MKVGRDRRHDTGKDQGSPVRHNMDVNWVTLLLLLLQSKWEVIARPFRGMERFFSASKKEDPGEQSVKGNQNRKSRQRTLANRFSQGTQGSAHVSTHRHNQIHPNPACPYRQNNCRTVRVHSCTQCDRKMLLITVKNTLNASAQR